MDYLTLYTENYKLAKTYQLLAKASNELHYFRLARKHFRLALIYKQYLLEVA